MPLTIYPSPSSLSFSFSPPLLPPPHLLLNSDRLGQRRTWTHTYIHARACVSRPHCHHIINRGSLRGLTACARSLTSSHTPFSVLGALPLLTLPTLPTSTQTLASDASFSLTVFSGLTSQGFSKPTGVRLSVSTHYNPISRPATTMTNHLPHCTTHMTFTHM